ncbi:hypothetical protein Q3G72_033227 [Acer saccharum]|nr:hypothetical protein Q3G72_033227 [Acer saccharum]
MWVKMDFGGFGLCFGELVFTSRIDCVLVVMKLNWRVGFRVEKRIDLVKKMEVEDEEDTCEMVVENIFVGGHSTFDIHFFNRMNLLLRFDEVLDPPKRPAL